MPITGHSFWPDIIDSIDNVQSKSLATIYRVPEELRKLNESAYTPRLVSIGPLHSQNENLKHNSYIKKFSVACLLHRVTENTEKTKTSVLDECLAEMRALLDCAKKRYAEEVNKLDEKMLVIDGCFVLEVLYSDYENKKNNRQQQEEEPNRDNQPNWTSNHPILGHPLWEENLKHHDLLLLENQLPFFVLKALFKLTLASKLGQEDGRLLLLYVHSYFGNANPVDTHYHDQDYHHHSVSIDCALGEGSTAESHIENEVYHILHVLHMCNIQAQKGRSELSRRPSGCGGRCGELPKCPSLIASLRRTSTWFRGQCSSCALRYCSFSAPALACLPPCCRNQNRSLKRCRLCCKKDDGSRRQKRSASELSDALVKFEALSTQDPTLLEVKFHSAPGWLCSWWRRARFEIPSLCVYYDTEPFLRNLIALEQCCPGIPRLFTWYASLMDKLISGEDDIKVLEKHKVIHNRLGNRQEAADLFNNLCKAVVLDEDHYSDKDKEYDLAVAYSNKCGSKAMGYLRRKYFDSPWTFIAFVAASIIFLISVTQFILGLLK